MPLIFIAILGVYQVLLLIVHFAVYKTFAPVFGIQGAGSETLFICLSLIFTVASVVAYNWTNRFVRYFYTISSYWFGLIHALFGAAASFVIIEWAELFFWHTEISQKALSIVLIAIWFLVHAYGTWQSSRAEITQVSVKLPGLPEHWRGKKIVFVSDLHLGDIWSSRFAEKITKKIQAIQPEAVLVGGDLFDGVACDPVELVSPLKLLNPPKGFYFVTGNHEYFDARVKAFLDATRGAGMRILDNEVVDLAGIQLAGVDYKTTVETEDFERVLGAMSIDPRRMSILMKHEPSNLPTAEKHGISLFLAGHTHHGQMFPLSYITRKVYKGFDYGLKMMGAMMVYTSSGVGTWGPPLRLGSKSEIVEITFE